MIGFFVGPTTKYSMNSTTIQALIDAKAALLAQVIAQIADLTANPKPNYSIDGQSVSWQSVFDGLVREQQAAIKALDDLTDLLNRYAPYQFVSKGC